MRILIIAIAAALFLVSPANAQTACGGASKPYKQATSLLKSLYGETLARRGTVSGNLVFELWENLDKGSTTLLRIFPSGCTQAVFGAVNWHIPVVEPTLPGEDGA